MNSGDRERVERRLAAILAADVAGYSRLMGEDEEGTLAALKTIRRELTDPKIAEHRGRIVKTTGDGLLVEFASIVDAVRCAVEVQREMAVRNASVPETRRIAFRIGINLGDIIIDEHDIYGDGVNVAARLEALASPGGVFVSGTVRDHVRDKLDCAFEDMGEQLVKNIARPVRVYRIPLAETARTKAPLPLPDKPSLAVLPFQNMTGDPEQDYFVDGMVEEITTAISRLPWLFVIARNSSFTYKGRAVDVRQVARELGVRYVLEGSVRKAGNRVRITGQLIDTATGAHIWANRFDGTVDDIFELQDQVASSVVGAIEPKLRQSEIARAIRKPTENLGAYDLYLRALAQFHKFSHEGMRNAITVLREALAIDPFYAPAAGLAGLCVGIQRAHGWTALGAADQVDAAGFASRAIEAGKEDADALWMGGYVIAVIAGEHATAASAVDRALALNPNSAHAWGVKGLLQCFLNRPEPAVEAIQRAIRLSPADSRSYFFAGGLAWAHMLAGRYDEAIIWANRAVGEQPRWVPGLRIKAALYGYVGRTTEAQECVKRMLKLYPGLTVANIAAYAAKAVVPEVVSVFVEGLRKAGLSED